MTRIPACEWMHLLLNDEDSRLWVDEPANMRIPAIEWMNLLDQTFTHFWAGCPWEDDMYTLMSTKSFTLSTTQILTHNNHYFFAASSDILSHGGRSKCEPAYALGETKEFRNESNKLWGCVINAHWTRKKKRYPNGTLDHGHSICFKWGGKVFVTPARTHQ